MTDEEIVNLYLQRDEAAVRETARKYGVRLRGLARRIVADAQTAEECENDTYHETWNSIPPHEPNQYFFAFLARITRHVSLNRCRANDRLKRKAWVSELGAELEQCIAAPDDETCRIDDLILRDTLNRFLAGLDVRKRNLFLRRYWFCDSVSDLANRFGTSQSNVRTTLYRLRGQLRKHLEKEGIYL